MPLLFVRQLKKTAITETLNDGVDGILYERSYRIGTGNPTGRSARRRRSCPRCNGRREYLSRRNRKWLRRSVDLGGVGSVYKVEEVVFCVGELWEEDRQGLEVGVY